MWEELKLKIYLHLLRHKSDSPLCEAESHLNHCLSVKQTNKQTNFIKFDQMMKKNQKQLLLKPKK